MKSTCAICYYLFGAFNKSLNYSFLYLVIWVNSLYSKSCVNQTAAKPSSRSHTDQDQSFTPHRNKVICTSCCSSDGCNLEGCGHTRKISFINSKKERRLHWANIKPMVTMLLNGPYTEFDILPNCASFPQNIWNACQQSTLSPPRIPCPAPLCVLMLRPIPKLTSFDHPSVFLFYFKCICTIIGTNVTSTLMDTPFKNMI